MQRVLVIGCSGAGKSTFARTLGELSGLPVIHIDQLFWQPNWVQVPHDVYLARLNEAISGERWIIDGNNPSTLDRRIPRADTIIWLHRSRAVCYWRIMQRVIGSYGRVRPDMAPGCPERFDWEFMKYIWRFPRDYHPRMVGALERHDAWARTIMLRNDTEARAFLRERAGT